MNGAFVPDQKRGPGAYAIAYMVAMTPLKRFLNHSQPGWPTLSMTGVR